MSVLGGNPLLLGDDGYLIQRSVRLRSSATAYFNRKLVSSGTTVTFSAWVKRGAFGSASTIFGTTDGSTYDFQLTFTASNTLEFYSFRASAVQLDLITTQVFRDPSAWYHIVLVLNTTNATAANRVQIFVNGIQVTALSTATYPAQNAVTPLADSRTFGIGNRGNLNNNYFDGYITEVNFVDGQALTASSFGEIDSTTGVWKPKKYTGTYGTNGFYLPFTDNTLNTLLSNSGNISAPYGGTATNALAADGVYCTSNVSAGSTFTFLLNTFATATQVTRYSITNLSFTGGASTFSIQSSPDNSTWTTLATLSVTASNQNFSGSLNGYARYFRIAPTSFGTNGSASVDAFLLYADGLGLDFSGNGNNWTPNNISVTAGVTYDSMTDVPTFTSPTQSNFPVLNAASAYAGLPITNANLQTTAVASGANWFSRSTTMGISSGKIYAEFSMPSITSGAQGNPVGFGIMPSSVDFSAIGQQIGASGYGYGFYCPDTAGTSPKKIVAGTTTAVGTGTATSISDVFMVAFDLTNGNAWFGKNGTWYAGDPSAGTGASITGITAGEYIFGLSVYRDGTYTNNTAAINFGQRPFAYTPPTGFKALNTFNLPAPTIPNGAAHFAATTYTGNGTAGLTISNAVNGTSFQPNFAWFKNRSVSWDYILVDSVRGVNLELYTSLTAAEFNGARVTSLNSNGFTVSSDPRTNGSGNGLVAWQWKAGGTAVTNTSGSITSSVSANPSAGFSIVTYTGNATANATVGHGLGVTPKFFVVKVRSTTGEWLVYHVSTGKDAFTQLQSTAAFSTSANYWGTTGPTSTTFQINGGGGVNNSGSTYVAYCFSEVAGFSKFGGYTGNGSVDGPFLYCGFRPRFILIKDYGNPASNWVIHDTARDTYNQAVNSLAPNTSAAESVYGSSYGIDVLSNGFKIRLVGSPLNTTNNGVLYAAFAENPFKYSLAR